MDLQNSVLLSFGVWTWMILGVVLMALELLLPGTVFLWFGVAALATGLIALQFGLAWQWQLFIFALLAVASLVVQRLVRRRFETAEDNLSLNQRAGRHVGRRFVLAEPIVSGDGRVRIDDTFWRVAGPDLPAGTEIVVTAVDGAILKVDRA